MSEAKVSRKPAVPVTEWFGDRELLKLAAKAVDIDLLAEEWEDGFIYYYHKIPGDTQGWNPLNCDSDALRLAVKLRIEIYIHENDTQCIGPNLHRAIETHEDDPYAATRRAIVRAAAEIGRGME
jgi:hypothetical protein